MWDEKVQNREELSHKKRNSNIPYLLTLQEGDDLEYIRKKIGILKSRFKQIFTKNRDKSG